MDWYYVHNGQREGPVSEEEFQSLVNTGMITSESLVWRQGMTQWRRYAEAGPGWPANPPSAGITGQRCVECGAVFPPDEMIHYGDKWVCAACKPVFFQRLREGSPIRGALNYAGFWIRFGAKFVDGLIMWVATMVVNLGVTGLVSLLGSVGDSGGAVFMAVQGVLFMFMMLAQLGIGVGYSTYFIGKYDATPGKMAFGLKVVTSDGGKVTYMRALARFLSEILSYMLLLLGYIIAAFDDEKRTLHDRICDTRVIYK